MADADQPESARVPPKREEELGLETSGSNARFQWLGIVGTFLPLVGTMIAAPVAFFGSQGTGQAVGFYLTAVGCLGLFLVLAAFRVAKAWSGWTFRRVGLDVPPSTTSAVRNNLKAEIRTKIWPVLSQQGIPATPEEFDERLRRFLLPRLIECPPFSEIPPTAAVILAKNIGILLARVLRERPGAIPKDQQGFNALVQSERLIHLLADPSLACVPHAQLDAVAMNVASYWRSITGRLGTPKVFTSQSLREAHRRAVLDLMNIPHLPQHATRAADACLHLFEVLVSHFLDQGHDVSFADWHGMLCHSIKMCDYYFATALRSPAYWAGRESFAAGRFSQLVRALGARAKELAKEEKDFSFTRVFITDTRKLTADGEESAWRDLVNAHCQNHCRILLRDAASLAEVNKDANQTFALFGSEGCYWALVADGERDTASNSAPLGKQRSEDVEKSGAAQAVPVQHKVRLRLELAQSTLNTRFGDIRRTLEMGCHWKRNNDGTPVPEDGCLAKQVHCMWEQCPARAK